MSKHVAPEKDRHGITLQKMSFIRREGDTDPLAMIWL